jgi:hypothetical protein
MKLLLMGIIRQGNDEMAEALRKEMLQTPGAEATEQ